MRLLSHLSFAFIAVFSTAACNPSSSANGASCLAARDGMRAPRCDGGNPANPQPVANYSRKSCEEVCSTTATVTPGRRFVGCFDAGTATAPDDGGVYALAGCEFVDDCECEPR